MTKKILIAGLILTLTSVAPALAGGKTKKAKKSQERVLSVWQDGQHGWNFINEIDGQPCGTPDCEFMTSSWFIEPSPTGDGGALLQKDTTGDHPKLPMLASSIAIRRGTRLRQITELTYTTLVEVSEQAEAVVLALDIDFDLTDDDTSFQGSMVFDPALQEDLVVEEEWQVWDAIDDGAAVWYFTQAPPTYGADLCSRAAPCTWADILDRFPGAGLHKTLGRLAFKTAGPGVHLFAGVDTFEVTARGDYATTYDFESSGPGQSEHASDRCAKYFAKSEKYASYGKFDKAAKYHEKALRCQADGGDHCLNYLDKSEKYAAYGNLAKAERYYGKYMECSSK